MKSLMLLLQMVLTEVGTRCGTSTVRDFKTVTHRVEHEGLSFLTMTLANFGADLQKGLDRGFVAHDLFHGFSWRGGLPRFLGGFLERVFDAGTGQLLDDPSIDAIHAVRQVTLMFAKIAVECSTERTAAAIDKFLECEQEVRIGDSHRDEETYKSFERVANLLLAGPLQAVEEDVYYSRIVPRHSSGATAERLPGNRKYDQREWTRRLEGPFPLLEYGLPSARYHHLLADFALLEPGDERPVRVITVPKTLKAPRVIAIEPTCMQYVQQGLMESLVRNLEEDDISSMFLGFLDQTPNQDLAREGSLTGRLATIDLSEASDRVSNQLVRRLLSRYPNLAEGVDASRSRKADVNGQVIRLAKFASMGSAICFPMEAMVFLTIVFLGIERSLNRPLTRRDILSLRGQVRVYGDDIVVPVAYVQSVVSELEAFGLRVNAGKSYWSGKFRESCGREFYSGQDVSIVRVRDFLPTRRTNVQEIIATVSLRNRMYYAGLWGTARWLDQWLERLIPLPTVAATSPVLGRHSLLPYQVDRWCPRLQSPLVKGLVVRTTLPVSKLDGVGALQKWFLKRGEKPYERDHLERSGRADLVYTKIRWASPF